MLKTILLCSIGRGYRRAFYKGDKCTTKMNPAIAKLAEYLSELEGVSDFKNIEDKAAHIGNMNLVKNAISQLELCDEHGINGGSLFSVLPETENPNFCYVVAHENESTNPENWIEVEFEKEKYSSLAVILSYVNNRHITNINVLTAHGCLLRPRPFYWD